MRATCLNAFAVNFAARRADPLAGISSWALLIYPDGAGLEAVIIRCISICVRSWMGLAR